MAIPAVAFSGPVPTPERPYLIERMLTPEEAALEQRLRGDEIKDRMVNAQKVLDKWVPQLKKHPQFKSGHITGWSVGYRRRFGQIVSPLQVVILLNVRCKMKADQIAQRDLADLSDPRDGVAVKILEGEFHYIPASAEATFARVSGGVSPENPLPLNTPLVGGIPVGPSGNQQDFGTLGVLLTLSNGDTVGLTNQHVLDAATDVWQLGPGFPPPTTTNMRPAGVVLGTPQIGNPNGDLVGDVDCAALSPPDELTSKLLKNSIRGLTHAESDLSDTGLPLFFADRRLELIDTVFPVVKFGGRSGVVREGRILGNANASVVVPTRNGNQLFENVMLVQHNENTSFVRGGDSGSALVLKAVVSGKPALIVGGLFFGRVSESVGVACHFSDVRHALNLKVKSTLLKKEWNLSDDDS